MALLDICLSEGDSQISQEEARGNIGVLTDVCAANTTQISEEIPSTGSSNYEVGFAYSS